MQLTLSKDKFIHAPFRFEKVRETHVEKYITKMQETDGARVQLFVCKQRECRASLDIVQQHIRRHHRLEPIVRKMKCNLCGKGNNWSIWILLLSLSLLKMFAMVHILNFVLASTSQKGLDLHTHRYHKGLNFNTVCGNVRCHSKSSLIRHMKKCIACKKI